LSIARPAIAVGLIAALGASANLFASLSTYDGGLAASSATFMLHGAFPYRDFWWLYGPGAPALVGAVTAVAGPSLVVLRATGLVLVAIQAGLAYVYIRERSPHLPAALIAVGATGFAAFLVGLEVTAWSLAMTLGLAGLVVRSRDPRFGLAAGLLIGAAFASRFDLGVYAFLAALLVGKRERLIVGFAIVALPIVVVALLTTPVADLVEQLIWYPLVGPRQFRGLPLPEIQSAALLAAVIATAVVPKVVIVLAAGRILVDRDARRPLIAMTVLAALCQLQTFGRSDLYHQAQASLPAYLLMGWLAGRSLTLGPTETSAKRRLTRLLVLGAAAGACALAIVVGAFSIRASHPGPLTANERELVAGIRTVVANTTPDEPIFVGLLDHRITFLNDALAYYLADRRAGVTLAMFNPGVTNTDRGQAAMVEELQESGTRLLLLNGHWAYIYEPTNDSAILGSTVLDRFIASNYVEACRFGEVRILATVDRASSVVCVGEREERLVDILAGIGG
jgi:hypothetical protein